MRPRLCLWCTVAAGLLGMTASPAPAAFHLIQIEQVIGGVNGDTSAQAIQLRLRFPAENMLLFARLRAWDAAGENPITLVDFAESVPNFSLGDRVLVASTNFAKYNNPVITADFIMTNLIPDSYLAAGRITYEADGGVIYWLLSYGGSSYTGPTTTAIIAPNDDDSDFGPPFDGPIPSGGVQALLFQGIATDLSVTNAEDYARTIGPAVFTNNAGQSTTLPCANEIDLNIGTDLKDFALFQSCFTDIPAPIDECCETANLNGDEAIDLLDYGLFHNALIGP